MYKELLNKDFYRALSIISAWLFVLLSYLVYFQNSFVLSVNYFIYTTTIKTSLYEYHNFWRFITTFGGAAFLSFATLCVVLYSYFHSQNYREAKVYAYSMFMGTALVVAVKSLTALERPMGLFAIEKSLSFPSGHTALACIFAVITGYYFVRDKRKRHKKLILTFIASYVLLISVSRLMLGEHWFFDIIGGLLLALSVSSAVILYFKTKVILT